MNLFWKLNRLFKSEEGTTLIASAILMPVLVASAGAAFDYSNVAKQRFKLQNYVDAAVLDSIWVNGLENSEATTRKRISTEYTDAIIARIELTEKPDNIVELEAEVKLDVPMTFSGLFGYDTIEISAAAKVSAVKKLTGVKFTPLRAQGYYPKKAELIIKRAGEPEKVVSTMYYRVGTNKPVCRRRGNLDLVDCNEIELGDFERAYLKFHIWECCGYIYRYDHRQPTNVVESDDPNEARRFFIDGVQQKDGASVNVFATLGCDETSRHEWEDLRVVSLNDVRDFVYDVTGYCRDVDPTKISLVK